jgi:hypothetical protein
MGIAVLLGVEVLGYLAMVILLLVGELGGSLQELATSSSLVAGLLIGGGALSALVGLGFLTPFFALCLFMDARNVAREDASWEPNPYLWGGIGLFPILATVVFPLFSGVMVPIGLLYLALRKARVGLFSSSW